MGISCTGIGENIINQAVAAKIATRVKDGMSLSIAVAQTSYVYVDGEQIKTFYKEKML